MKKIKSILAIVLLGAILSISVFANDDSGIGVGFDSGIGVGFVSQLVAWVISGIGVG